MEGDGVSAVCGSGEACRAALDGGDLVANESSLNAEYASRALLAGQAMAHGYPHRLALAGEMQLSAAAGGATSHR
jgi:hypothetical protein